MLKLIGILTIVWVVGLLTLALCKAASRADRWEEEHRKDFDGYKWCNDDCYRCEQSDWCKFSEVKKGNING